MPERVKTCRALLPAMNMAALLAAVLLLGGEVGCGGSGTPRARITFEGRSVVPASHEAAGSGEMRPGRVSRITFTVTVRPERKIAKGGGIRIEQGRIFNGRPVCGPDMRYAFPDPVPADGPVENRLAVRTEGSPFRVALQDAGFNRRSPQVVFPEGLAAGEAVAFVFGDKSDGGPGMAVPVIPMTVELISFIDRAGDGNYVPADGSHPKIESRVLEADRLRVAAPSTAKPGDVSLRIVPVRGGCGRETSSFPVSGFCGSLAVCIEGDGRAVLAQAVFEQGRAFEDVIVRLDTPGVYRLRVEAEGSGLSGTSNPVLVLGDERDGARAVLGADRILWGSLQSHTSLGGHALGLPDEAFETARGPGCLDFCAITDHSSNPSFHWDELRTLPDRYDAPGEFVAFAGYEWTSARHGHRHIILKNGAGTTALSEAPTDDPAEAFAPTLADFARLAGSDPNALIAVHHTTLVTDSSFPDYDFGADRDMPRQRLFEVFSWHGSAEHGPRDNAFPIHGTGTRSRGAGSSFRDALAAGRRFFVTGDSDSHVGMPGIPVAVVRSRGLRYGYSGVTAVMTSSFDREGVFGALEKGRCYGTTGARIVLLFNLAGAGPGESVKRSGELEAHVEIHGTASIDSVRILRDGQVLVVDERPGDADFARAITLDGEPEEGVHSYYLRVEQKDGNQAWTSPVWIDRGGS